MNKSAMKFAGALIASMLAISSPSKAVPDHVKHSFLDCIDQRSAFSKRCRAIREKLDSELSRVERDYMIGDLLAKAGVKILNDSDYEGNTRRGPSQYLKECRAPGLQGFYMPADHQIMICTNNAYRLGTSWEIEVMSHEAVHAAQGCVGGPLREIPAIKKAFFSNPRDPSAQRIVSELYAPEQMDLEMEAREFNGDHWDIAILVNYACSKP